MTQPDKLFKDKLENHESPAPLSAWNRVESNLDHKSNRGLWMKIAAGLLLLAIAGTAWYASTNNSATTQQLASTNTSNTQEEIEHLSPAEQPTETIEAEVPATNSMTETSTKKVLTTKKTLPPKVNAESNYVAQVQPSTSEQKAEEVFEPTINIQNIIVSEKSTPVLANLNTEETESNVIVYTAEEVNEKFLKKNSVSATSEDKKPSGIQRLITLAADLKNTEGGLGELRDKKNELLALNFRKNNEAKNN